MKASREHIDAAIAALFRPGAARFMVCTGRNRN